MPMSFDVRRVSSVHRQWVFRRLTAVSTRPFNTFMSYRFSLSLFALVLFALAGPACSDNDHHCFGAGTLIATPRGAVPIESLVEGDLVWSYDLDLRRRVAAPILNIFGHRDGWVRDLRLASGRVLRVTREHPIYVPGESRYAAASELSVGAKLLQVGEASSETVILSFPERATQTTVYNLEVAGFHNYFAEGVLVHNKQPPGWPPDEEPGDLVGAACEPPASRCVDWPLAGVEEDLACALDTPPKLVDACTGTESMMNPANCTAEGEESTHRVRFLALAGTEYFPELGVSTTDCSAGFDLDGCDGTSCAGPGSSFALEGTDGVDNGLAALARLFEDLGTDLSPVNQALYDGLCAEVVDIAWVLAPNFDESCINVTLVIDGTPANEATPMNLTDEGCMSGTIGTVPLPIAGTPGALMHAMLRGTVDVERGFEVELGGTLDMQAASTLMEAVIVGGGSVVERFFEINEDLSGDNNADCTALSVTFDMGAAP